MQCAVVATIAALAGHAAAGTVSVSGVQDEAFFTLFNDAGEVGEIYAPSEAENPIGAIADFSQGPGRRAFIQNGPYYLQNPNALAWAGNEAHFIFFNVGVSTVSLAVRGTSEGDQAGPNGQFPFTADDGPFSDAVGILYALDVNGERIATAFIENGKMQSNDPSELVQEINFSADELGVGIWGLEFVNDADPASTGVFIGGLGVTPIGDDALSLQSVQDEALFTTFNDAGAVGEIYAPSEAENPIGGVADFSAGPGRRAFIQNGPYYLVNPNALAWAGEETHFITFNTPISTVSLAVRGTAEGDQAGPNGQFPFTQADGPFADANAKVWPLDQAGDRLGVALIENGKMQSDDPSELVQEINFSATTLGQSIWGLEFGNDVDDPYGMLNTGVFIGGLGVTPLVQEPVSLAGVQDEAFFTTFNDAGAVGEVYAPSEAENPIGGVADFSQGPGRRAFIQNGPYYLVNPNALAWAGEETHFILFNVGIASVSLAVRGTSEGDQAGPNGQFPFTIDDGPFADADAAVYALDVNGERLGGAPIENAPLQSSDPESLASEINFLAADLGAGIWGLEFVNDAETDGAGAGVFIGGLGVTPISIPCPGDLNDDLVVDSSDLNILLAAFGVNAAGDLDNDGDTDSGDLNGLLFYFSSVCG